MTLLAACLAALLPCLALREVNETGLAWLRDRCLWGLAAYAAALACLAEPWLAPICLVVLGRWAWQGGRTLPSVVSWAAVISVWFLVPAGAAAWLPWVWAAALAYQSGWVCIQWWTTRKFAVGSLGQRTFVGGLIALLLPLVASLPWPAAIPVAGLAACALWLCSSWLAYAALVAAAAVAAPWTLAVSAPAAGLVAWTLYKDLDLDPKLVRTEPGNWIARYTTRGDSLDSVRERLWTWDACLRLTARWPTWLIGAGPHRMAYDLMRWTSRYHAPLATGHAHNELLEATYEWGLAVPLTLAGLAIRLWPHLHAHDPWTAAVVVGAVLMLGTLAARVTPIGLVWWVVVVVVAHR